MPALAFEWRWDGSVGGVGGDHALLMWALQPLRVFHLYYHCPGDSWVESLPELRRILGSFELLDRPPEGGWA